MNIRVGVVLIFALLATAAVASTEEDRKDDPPHEDFGTGNLLKVTV